MFAYLTRLVLLGAGMLLLALAAFGLGGGARVSVAQTVTIDYDQDNDGLIEVRNNNQFRAINDDRDGDGIVTSSSAYWNTTGYPNAMTGAGCPARDHDGNPSTADEARCIGYELTQDLIGPAYYITGTYTAKIIGNGFRIVNSTVDADNVGVVASTLSYTGTIEGIGVINPSMTNHQSFAAKAGVVHRLEGDAIGVYVEGGSIFGDSVGGIARYVTTNTNDGEGLIAHSYVLGTRIGSQNFEEHGGLAATWEHGRGSYRSTCVNSWVSAWIDSNASHHGLIGGVNQNTQARIVNCYGDGTTDTNENAFGQNNITGPEKTKAEMTNPTGYTGIYADWDNYAADGTQLGATDDPTDFWYFGDSTTFPALKAFGHDRTHAPARSTTGSDTVNLCTRTLPVANAIIELLNDTHVLQGVTPTPSPTALQPCTSASDTRSVTITQLAQLAVTGPGTHLNLRPDRTFPPSEKLTKLEINDFAYLTNVAHIELAGNDLETLPPRLFHGVGLRYLDLSGNKLTSLPADLFAGIATVNTTVGNAILLSDNTLTDTGLPGRIFDPLTHINGLDLSNNALTRVNTRWFEKLVHLGAKATSGPTYTHGLGLHLAGNTITEHYYSHKLFSGIRDNVVTYADTTSGTPPTATTAGDALRTAITAAITAGAGGTTPTTLSLTGTDHYFNTGGTTGYQASTVTACQATQTAAPGRYAYLENDAPDCQIQPHWSPPHKSADTAATAPGLSTSGSRGTISVEFTHASSTAFVAYQLRYRPSSIDPWTPWLVAPITLASGTKTVTIGAPESGLGYAVEMRVLTTTGPPSAPISGTATTSPSDWLAGYSVAASTTTTGAIDLSWTAFDASQLPAGHTLIEFYYRYKLSTTTYYGAWTRVPDGSDTGNSLHDETSYTLAGLTRDVTYDVQLVGGIDSADSDTDADYFTNRQSGSAASFSVPANLRAVPGSTPGTIAVTWSQQSLATTAQSRFRIRWKRKSTAAWTGATWTAVADSDSDSQTHDETAYTITGLLASTEEYDIEVAFYVNSTVQWLDPLPVSAFANAIPAPTGVTATPSTTLGQINVSWDQQRYSTAGNAKLQVRVQWSTGGTWIAWQDVSDGADPGSLTHDEIAHTVTGLAVGRPHDVQVRIVVGSTGGTVAQVDDVRAGFHPQGMTATPGDVPGTIDVTWTQQTVYAEAWRRFHISPKLSTAGTWQSWINIADETADSHQLTGLTAGQLYDVRMMFNRNSEHDWPDQTFVPMLTGIRAGFVQAPTNFRVVPSTTAVGALDLSWDQQTASTDSMSKFQYRIRLSSATDWTGVTWQDIGDGSDDGSHAYDETSVTVSGLQVGMSYDVELRFHWNSTHGESTSVSTMAVSASVPSPPNFRAEAGATSGALVLTWDAMTGIDRFQYRYRTTGASSYGSWTDNTDSNSNSNLGDETTETITTGLTAGTEYDFELRAVVGSTNSTAAEASARAQRHSVPTSFAVAVGSNPGELDLSWGTPAAGTTVAGFQYRHKPTDQPDSAYTNWMNVPDSGTDGRADERAYTITSLWAGVSHDIQISTESGSTRSVPNPATTATATPTPVAAPTALTGARGTTTGAIDLTWTAPASATLPTGDSIAHYQYRAKPASSATWGDWTDIPAANAATYTATVPNAYTLYDVELRAAVADGTEGTATTAEYHSTAASATGIRSGIASPADLTATTGTNPGEVNLTWTAQTTFGAAFTTAKYQVRYKPADASWPATTPFGWTDVTGSNRASSSYTLTGVDSGLNDIELRFVPNSSLTSAAAEVQATPLPVPAQSGLSATTSLVAREVDLSWDAQTAHQGANVNFQVRAKPTDEATWPTVWTDVPDGTGMGGDADTDAHNETGYTIDGLDARRPYDFQLRLAIGGAGGPAIEVTNVRAGYQPRGLGATTGTTPGTIDVSWTMQTANQGSGAAFLTRAKPATGSWPSNPNTIFSATEPAGWRTVLDSDGDTLLHDEDEFQYTGLQGGVLYDIVVSFAPDAVNYTHRDSLEVVQARAGAVAAPTGFGASTSNDTAAAVDLSWDQQMASTLSDSKFQYRYKLASTQAWSTETWNDVDDGGTSVGDSDANHHNETGVTVTGLTAGSSYDFELRFLWNSAIGSSTAVSRSATASTIPAPPNFSASSGTAAGTVDLTWDTVNGITKYQYRYKKADANTHGTWADIPDDMSAADPDTDLHDETSYTVTGLDSGDNYEFHLRAHTAANTFGAQATATARAQTQAPPTSFTASTGTNPGEIDLTWVAPTIGTITRFEYRYKVATAGSYPATWQQVPDGSDSGNSQADETEYTIGSLWAGVSYKRAAARRGNRRDQHARRKHNRNRYLAGSRSANRADGDDRLRARRDRHLMDRACIQWTPVNARHSTDARRRGAIRVPLQADERDILRHHRCRLMGAGAGPGRPCRRTVRRDGLHHHRLDGVHRLRRAAARRDT